MRKSNREVTDKSTLVAIIANCDVCRVAFFDDTHPYIVPMNFGCDYSGDLPILYFHCAVEGRKLDLLRRNPNVGFEISRLLELKTGDLACKWSANYESIIGEGKIAIVTDPDERIIGLSALMEHYGAQQGSHIFDPGALGKTVVLRLKVVGMTGKRLEK